MMTIDRATDIVRGMRAKTRRPAEKRMLPQYMQSWDDKKIDEYYEKQKEYGEALSIAIRCMKGISQFEKVSNDIVDLLDNFEKDDKRE